MSRGKAAAVTEVSDRVQAPPDSAGTEQGSTHPDGGGHVIRTHLGEVPLQHPIVEAIEEEGDPEVHGIFWLDSTREEPTDTKDLVLGLLWCKAK